VSYEYIKPTGIHLEITRRCTLKCPKCPRTTLKGMYDPNTDLSLDAIKNLLNKNKFDLIECCGNLGDPIYHPQALEIFKYLSDNSKSLMINTNGSGKKISWWSKYYNAINKKDITVFGVDGLKDTSKLYRVNQNWDSVFEAMKLGATLGHKVVWQWIPFSFNEHQIPEARLIAKRYNIQFLIFKSERWDKDDPMKPSNKELYIENESFLDKITE
tara:strand:- start:8842 stop:9483 length:642 start_codon:yes stop_codon:yes gene_type:complete